MFGTQNTYEVYIKELDEEPLLEKTIFLKEGFSISAFLFNFFWLVYHRVWPLLAVYFAFSIGLKLIQIQFNMGEEFFTIINLGFLFWLGFEANDWRGQTLRSKGYALADIVTASNEFDAQKSFFERNQDLIKEI